MESKTIEWVMMHLVGTIVLSFAIGLLGGYLIYVCEKTIKNYIAGYKLRKATEKARSNEDE